MRTETYTRNIYTLDEVCDAAIEKNWDINVDLDWWNHIYDDAEMIGLKLDGFDLDRGLHCVGKFTEDACCTANMIISGHGENCDTYKLAEAFLAEQTPLKNWLKRVEDSNFDLLMNAGVYAEYRRKESLVGDLESEFLEDLLGAYAWALQHEYEYLTSEEAIEETLRANEYEFYADGSIA